MTWNDYLPDGTTFADIDRYYDVDYMEVEFECEVCGHLNVDAEAELSNPKSGYGWASYDVTVDCSECGSINTWRQEDVDESVLEDF